MLPARLTDPMFEGTIGAFHQVITVLQGPAQPPDERPPRSVYGLAKHLWVQLYYTPMSASWLNLVEVLVSIIESQALRRGGGLRQRQRGHHRHQALLNGLEPALPAVCLDQARRCDARQAQPSNQLSDEAPGRSYRNSWSTTTAAPTAKRLLDRWISHTVQVCSPSPLG
jgi:hypothetical protein